MICYRDMTFCKFSSDCAKEDECPRALTEEVRKAAREWWGSDDAPIATWVDKPICWVLKEGE